jgi:pimeloyl-ACP methyl ester carboxylesterase
MGLLGEEGWTHRTFDVGEVRLHAVETGEGPLVVLLHGFPDFWYGWRHQLGALAAAGFRVVAPDMRGYNLSDKPAGVWSYGLDRLAADVAGLVRACGATRARVVGHDWGGIVAWHAALRHEGLVERLAILNAPTPGALRGAPMPPDQLLRSWYISAFQLPGLPEAALSFHDFALLRSSLAGEVKRPGALTKADLDRYAAAFAEPGALSAAIDYYRALPWSLATDAPKAADRFDRPTLVVWGEQDPHLAPALAGLDPARVPHGRVERFPDAGHWVHLDATDPVNGLLVAFLKP